MLGRKTYTKQELKHAQTAVKQQLSAYKKLVKTLERRANDPEVASALAEFELLLFKNLTLALDRYFVHRLRAVTGKDTNALNEVELVVDSLMKNGGKLHGNNVIKYHAEKSVLKLESGQPIRIDATQFERLAKAYLADIKTKFVD
jgi:hypothetical protein